MWSALENIALRESLPASLDVGQSIHGILINRQTNHGRHNLQFIGRRRSQTYLLKQFFSLDTNAFLRWQNEARFISIPQTSGYAWPNEEWRGGVISPLVNATPLNRWLAERSPSIETRLNVAAKLASQIQRLHASGIIHRGLTASSIFIQSDDVVIANFGAASCSEWDDFWSDSIFSLDDTTCVSSEFWCDQQAGECEDVHALGALLYFLLTNTLPYGTIKQKLRPLLPGFIRPNKLPEHAPIPLELRNLITACLALNPIDRPSMSQIVHTFDQFYEEQVSPILPIDVPIHDASIKDKKKTLVFITDDNRAVPTFDEVLLKHEEEPTVFLFIGLIPNNLPSGHAERFKGSLFRKISQGLTRCRATSLRWSLRVLENTVPEKTALELIRQYSPDQILLGESKNQRFSFNRCLYSQLQHEDIHIVSVT